MKKRFASLFAVAAIGAVGLVGGATAHPPAKGPIAQISKYCSAAALGYGDKNAQTPGGVKCLGVNEFCSHKPGYAAAYRKAGFKCKANGRLAYR